MRLESSPRVNNRREAIRSRLHGQLNGKPPYPVHGILQADTETTQDHVRGQGVPVGSSASRRKYSRSRLQALTNVPQYAFASHVAIHDYPPSSLLPVDPLPGEYTLRTEEILKIIEEQGDSIAIICFGAIQYYSGEFFDLEKITKAGHAKVRRLRSCFSVMELTLPFPRAAWSRSIAHMLSAMYHCNSTTGASTSLAGAPTNTSTRALAASQDCSSTRGGTTNAISASRCSFGLENLVVDLTCVHACSLAGWWGHDLTTRFAMPSTFSPLPGAAAWQFSNPSVLDVVSLLSSLRLFESAGNVLPSTMSGGHGSVKAPILAALREKSLQLTFYLETLLKSSHFYISPEKLSAMAQNGEEDAKSPKFTIITPSDPERRGAQLSLLFSPVEVMDPIFERLREGGVLGDERRPGVIRFAPVPMYNSWSDCCEAARVLEKVLLEVVREGQAGLVDLSKGGHGSAEGGNRGLGVEADDDGVRRSSEVRTR